MKKRLMALGLIFAMMFSVTAYGSETSNAGIANDKKTAYQMYQDAYKALEDAGSYQMNIDMDMCIDLAGLSIPMKTTGYVKQVKDGNDIKLETILNTEAMGAKAEVKSYYTDGFMYMNAAGQKSKTEMSIEDAMGQADSGAGGGDIDESDVKDQKVSGNTAELTIDKSAIDKLAGSQMKDLKNQLGSNGEVNFSDIVVKLSADGNGALKTADMSFSVVITTGGQSMSMSLTMKSDVVKIGGVSITLPDDLNTY